MAAPPLTSLLLLPDGEVHACRKFPLKIGTINDDDRDHIYHSDLAEPYRNGPNDCRGCLAVAYGSRA